MYKLLLAFAIGCVLSEDALDKNPESCPQSILHSARVRMLVTVPSAAANMERRTWIRECHASA